MGDEMMSCTSCVTVTTSPKCLRTVLYKYWTYEAILLDASAFHASSIISILRMPLSRRILLMKTSISTIVTIGNSSLLSLMASISKTMKRLESRSISLGEFSRKS